jgi:hypothetical protein
LLFGIFFTKNVVFSAPPDTLEIKLPSVLSFSSDYSGNTNTFGRFNSMVSQPNYSLSSGYYGKRGLIVNTTGLMIGNSDTTNSKATYEFDLMLGYNLKFLKYFSITPSYTHFLYSKNNTTLISAYNQYLQANLSFNYKWVSVSLTGGHTFGNYEEPILQFSLGVPLTFNNTFFKDHTLIIQPTFDASLGNQDYYNTYAYNNLRFLLGYTYLYPNADFSDFYDFVVRDQGTLYDNYLRFYPGNSYNDFIQFLESKNTTRDGLAAYRSLVRTRIVRDKNAYNWLYNQYFKNPSMEINSVFSANRNFNFNSIGMVVPLYYSISDFTFSISLSAYKPLNTPSYLDDDWVFYFSAGLSYDLFLKK